MEINVFSLEDRIARKRKQYDKFVSLAGELGVTESDLNALGIDPCKLAREEIDALILEDRRLPKRPVKRDEISPSSRRDIWFYIAYDCDHVTADGLPMYSKLGITKDLQTRIKRLRFSDVAKSNSIFMGQARYYLNWRVPATEALETGLLMTLPHRNQSLDGTEYYELPPCAIHEAARYVVARHPGRDVCITDEVFYGYA